MAFWRKGTAASSSSAEDTGLAEFHRAVAAVEGAPPGNAGAELSPAQVVDEAHRLRQLLAADRNSEAWARRVQLGYGLSLDCVERSAAFWVNAAAALAALRSGQKAHPMVAMCAGACEEYLDQSDAEQTSVKDEIYQRYFG
jgi:hypothetical protein